MTKRKKYVIVGVFSALAVIIITFVGVLMGTNVIQLGLIRMMCTDKPSTYPENYTEIESQTTLTTHEYIKGSELDVIEPKDGEIKLNVLVFHGGYYSGGGRHNQEPYSRLLATYGYRVVNVDYPLAPESVYPAQITAANQALKFISEKYPDTNNVLSGDSAGAHLASQLTAVITDKELASKIGINPAVTPYKLAGFVGHCGFYEASSVKDTGFFLIERSLKILTGDSTLDKEKLSQMDVVNSVAGFPPTLLVCGDKDNFLVQNQLMKDALQTAGVRCDTYFPTTTDKELGHEFQCNYDLKESYTAMERIVGFLISL